LPCSAWVPWQLWKERLNHGSGRWFSFSVWL